MKVSRQKQKDLIRDIKIVEDAVSDEIKISRANMVCEPVDDLEELLFWENRLGKLKRDYIIAEFNYTIDEQDRRVFGIFANMDNFDETANLTPFKGAGLGESVEGIDPPKIESFLDFNDLETYRGSK